MERFAASTSEPLIVPATSFALATSACAYAVLMFFSTAATESLSSARTSTTFTRFFWPESFWSCASGR